MPAVRQGHNLTLTFQLPSLFHAYRAKPDDYVSHLIGHEGRGSLLSALKARGLASAISAGVNESGYERNSALFVFEVTIILTEAGLHQSPGMPFAPHHTKLHSFVLGTSFRQDRTPQNPYMLKSPR